MKFFIIASSFLFLSFPIIAQCDKTFSFKDQNINVGSVNYVPAVWDYNAVQPILNHFCDSVYKELAKFLASKPTAKIAIETHVDERGGEAYNQKLTDRRALTLMEYLILTYKISPNQISAKGFGESNPIVPLKVMLQLNLDQKSIEDFHNLNRRTLLRVLQL